MSTAQTATVASCDRSTNADPEAFCLDKPTRYWFGFRATDKVDDALQILEGAIGTLERFTANNEDMPDSFVHSIKGAILQATEDLQGHRAELKRNAEGIFERFLRAGPWPDESDEGDATPTAAQPPETEAASQPMVAGKPAESTPAAGPDLKQRLTGIVITDFHDGACKKHIDYQYELTDAEIKALCANIDDWVETMRLVGRKALTFSPTPAADPVSAESPGDHPTESIALDRLIPLLRRCTPAYHTELAGEIEKHLKDWGERFANTTEHFEKPSSPDRIQPSTPAVLDNCVASMAACYTAKDASGRKLVDSIKPTLPNMDPTPRRCINVRIEEQEAGESMLSGDNIIDESVWVTESEAADLAMSVASAVAGYTNCSRIDGRND